MSAFEVVITPTRLKAKKRFESREPTEVLMAPFSAKSIVQFEDIPVGKSAKRILRVANPTEEDIEVKVLKALSSEYNVGINWTTTTVPALSEVDMEMIWNPTTEVTCKETMQLLDNRNFRKDVMVILKTRSSKPAKPVRRFPTVSSSGTHVRTLRLKSPTGSGKAKKLNLPVQRKSMQHIEKSVNQKPRTSLMKPTWNASTSHVVPRQKQRDTIDFMAHTSPLMERNVHVPNRSSIDVSPLLDVHINDALKENVSPLTPSNVIKLIDDIKFTPVNGGGLLQACSNLDNLASWPTPVSTQHIEENVFEVRPRRLTAAELADEAHEETRATDLERRLEELLNDTAGDGKSAAHYFTNKTFEINLTHADALDVSSDSLDGSLSFTVPMNKTTTITRTPATRPLAMIQEEEADSLIASFGLAASVEKRSITPLQKTYVKSDGSDSAVDEEVQNLKRDIKLVGTPLRKYSESMKDLSLKSPQVKFTAIQGSMPNLNEMGCIRSIEQNRYFYQCGPTQQELEQPEGQQENVCSRLQPQQALNESAEGSSCSEIRALSPLDGMFNQSEILAQSSRFNLNEVGIKSRCISPVTVSGKWKNLRGASPKAQNKPTSQSKTADKKCPQKRNLHELSFSDAPSSESLTSGTPRNVAHNNTGVNTTSTGGMLSSPPKRQRIEGGFNFMRPASASTSSSFSRAKCWSRTQPKKLKLVKPTTPRKATPTAACNSDKLYDPELYLQSCINPDPFAASTTCDPFLASTMYLDEQAVDKHQQDFKKWLNALVSIPADLDTNCDTKVDVGKLFSEVRHKELTLAPTKEEQSMHYLVLHRLESVRRAAVQLYLSEEMRVPCTKVAVYVSKNAIRIRNDRNLHLDVVMQRYILELLLCFNPLWLRLGLEVVYGEKIHLRSNSDIVGLSTFILNRLFRDRFLEEKFSRAYSLSDEYAEYVKKHTLTKMLCLLLFLDKAKQRHIIRYNPCLFVKKSPHKETKDILLKFSSELLANMGDITRDLKRLGYVLEHKQTFLDEYSYAFNNLAVDLRDGIRLTRVMEIILLRDGLSKQLRVPAISRLQRIFNVNLALRALSDAEFQLRGEITAADIVDGHREKTLSLLWQIIYKFRSPKFHAAARVLQQWWRHRWLRVVIKRRIRDKEERQRQLAATRIQAFYRGYMMRRYTQMLREERTRAALVLQKHARRFLVQNRYKRSIAAATLIQRWYRTTSLVRYCRQQFLVLRGSTVFLQRCYKRRLLSRKLLLVADEYRRYYEQRRVKAAEHIQHVWRTYCETKQARDSFLRLRRSAIVLQQQWRARRAMQKARAVFLQQLHAIVWVQQHFRANRRMRVERNAFEKLRNAAVAVQRRYRALRQMRAQRASYAMQRLKIVKAQRRFRGLLEMRCMRASFQRQRTAAMQLQRWYRAALMARRQKHDYQLLRSSCVRIQRKWRATLAARQQRLQYKDILQRVVRIQRQWRATLCMRNERQRYVQLRLAACVLQRRFRARQQMLLVHSQYLLIRTLVICVQRKYRAHRLMLAERHDYLLLRRTVLHLQQKFRGRRAMEVQRAEYALLCRTVVHVQQKFRGCRETRLRRAEFVRMRRVVTNFEAHARGYLARQRLQALMTPELVAQRRRAKAARIIQRFWRGYRVRQRFQNMRVRLIRRNIALLRETSQAANSISNKMKYAVRILRANSSASEMLHVLMCLDRLSRNVPHMLMEHSDFISTFCYGIMAQTIRSEVDKQLIRYCSRIILNLARYNSTTANTFQENGLVTIAQMLLRWCDKDSEIFNTLCTLIWLFAHCAHKRQIIRDFMTTPEAIYVVRETKKLVARKERMNHNLRKPLNSLRSSEPQQFSSRAMPGVEPDYGVVNSKPYTFISSVFAFDTLLTQLEIDIY